MYLEMLPTSKICQASSYVMPRLLACEPFFKIKFCCLSFENENSSSKSLIIFFSHFNFLSPVFILLFPHSSLPDILFFLLTSPCKLCTIFLKKICLSGSSSLSLTIFPVFFFNPPTPQRIIHFLCRHQFCVSPNLSSSLASRVSLILE